jgi:hypothetical protein
MRNILATRAIGRYKKRALDDPHHPVLNTEEVRVLVARVFVNPLN